MLEEVTLRKAVEFAIETEKLGGQLYSRFAQRFADEAEVAEVFAKLAKDEEMHEARFAALLDELPDEPQVDFERKQYLRAISLSDVFSGESGLRATVDKVKNRDDALQAAFELEKTTLLYYEGVKQILGSSEILDKIIAEEQEHVVQLMKVLVTGAKFRGIADKF